jgi:hypothetical protein
MSDRACAFRLIVGLRELKATASRNPLRRRGEDGSTDGGHILKVKELEIDVIVFGKEYVSGPNRKFLMAVAYEQASATPHVAGIVSETGDIDLTKFPNSPDYNQQVDITFRLKTLVEDQRGHLVPVAWETPAGDAIKVTPNPGKAMAASLTESTTLVLDNQNNDGRKYRYSLSIFADGIFKVPWTFDPGIENKPKPPF